jgi:adenylate kinase
MTRSTILALAIAFAACSAFAQQPRKLIIILLGPPGAGKTTHAQVLKREMKLPIISGEELIKSSNDKRIPKHMKNTIFVTGEVLDDTIMNSLIRQRISRGDCANGFILDGFPRSAGQGEELQAMAREIGLPPAVVIHLQAPDDVVRQRLIARGKGYDKPEIVDARIKAYREEEAAVLAMVSKERLVAVDATRPIKEVDDAIRAAIARLGQ